MDAAAFVRKFENLLELDENSILVTTALADVPAWDSMAVLAFLDMADEEFGATPSPKAIAGCRTVQDLLALVEAK
jgi:acyl carrier protein